jgi:SpoVK/Ycf46/Vps4 family AAA+-type ATPase
VYATLPSLLLILSSREGKLDADYIAVNFHVDDIKPINWNDDAYDHLVYQEEQKDLVLTFVDNHKRLKHGVDDVIVGKGQGLIMLLSGPPGTGKTLTAEAGEFVTGRI